MNRQGECDLSLRVENRRRDQADCSGTGFVEDSRIIVDVGDHVFQIVAGPGVFALGKFVESRSE